MNQVLPSQNSDDSMMTLLWEERGDAWTRTAEERKGRRMEKEERSKGNWKLSK